MFKDTSTYVFDLRIAVIFLFQITLSQFNFLSFLSPSLYCICISPHLLFLISSHLYFLFHPSCLSSHFSLSLSSLQPFFSCSVTLFPALPSSSIFTLLPDVPSTHHSIFPFLTLSITNSSSSSRPFLNFPSPPSFYTRTPQALLFLPILSPFHSVLPLLFTFPALSLHVHLFCSLHFHIHFPASTFRLPAHFSLCLPLPFILSYVLCLLCV